MITIDSQDLVDLPVDQLGLLILADFAQTLGWNERNYVLEAEQRTDYDNEAVRAIVEAFSWLRARGLTAHNPSENAPDTIFVTRTGQRVLDDGPDAFYATERLQRGLHPKIEQAARPQFLVGAYDLGVFAAMKAVEVRVRKLGGFGNDDHGVDLMNHAFGRRDPLSTLLTPRANAMELEHCSPVRTPSSATRLDIAKSTTPMSTRPPRPFTPRAC